MVYVQNHLGQPLMPTQDHRKVRLLLKAGAAVVVRRTPFTIRLTTRTKTSQSSWVWTPAARQLVCLRLLRYFQGVVLQYCR